MKMSTPTSFWFYCSYAPKWNAGKVYWRELAFQNGLGSPIKQLKTLLIINSLKQLKIANLDSRWAYTPESSLSECFLRMTFISGRAYFRGGLLSEFYGISPRLILAQKSGEGLFLGEFIIGKNFKFQKRLGLTINKQLETLR